LQIEEEAKSRTRAAVIRFAITAFVAISTRGYSLTTDIFEKSGTKQSPDYVFVLVDSAKSVTPCNMCWCKGEDFSDPGVGSASRLRTTAEMDELRETVRNGKATAAEKRKHSIHLEKSGFRDLWWGANPYGIHLAAGAYFLTLL